MILKKYFLLLTVTIVGILLGSCKRDLEGVVGPAICATDNFGVTEEIKTNLTTIDFSKVDSIKVTAKFDEKVSWTVAITGKTSGARKTFEGLSDNVNVGWWGEPDSLLFFENNEECIVDLNVSCKGIVSSNAFKILKVSTFKNFGVMGYDLDNNQPITIVYPNPLAVNMVTTYKTDTEAGNVTKSPQGGKFFHITTMGSENLVWYFGGFDIMGNPSTLAKFAKEDPRNVYMNFFVNVNGYSLTQTQIIIFEGPAKLKRLKAINGAFAGWKYISFPLSDMNVEDISQIRSIDVNIGASPDQARNAEMNLDLIMLTKGKPFLKKG